MDNQKGFLKSLKVFVQKFELALAGNGWPPGAEMETLDFFIT